ncbi:MAG: type I-U CRISPR-associated protein Csb2 [Peptococcaceae bacterium]|jgi:CRISPR-associated protein Csb2|nr:type I-U CRISPR-associated protein Csb2 [Peptococcaceae bacterium]
MAATDILIVTVIYLDKYHGKEWPPSPFRCFQALIAAAKTGYRRVQWSPEKEDALRWLESLPPPTIIATPARPAPSYLGAVKIQTLINVI